MPHKVINGNKFNNTLIGTATHDTINGFGGHDILNGKGNNDILNGDDVGGAQGHDTLYGGDGDDTLNGRGGDDYLDGWIGNDTLNGGDGIDFLRGWTGKDALFGGNGDDTLNGGFNNDLLDGGAGNDTADYSTALAGVTVSLLGSSGEATGGAGSDTLVSIENLTGSRFDDSLNIDESENSTFNGGGGNDRIEVNHSVGDMLNGEAGNDMLILGNGFSTLNGGDGDDYLNGGDGGVLNGGDGDDVLEAESSLDDTILNGGAGADTLLGSGITIALETYDYNAVSDSPSAGMDTIVNFVDDAQIDLHDIDANSLMADNQDFTYIGALPFSGTAGELRYGGDGILRGDIDGDGSSSEFRIELVGAPALSVGGLSTDIIL